ncbi:MAG: PKD domain-containing protein [Bacteroidales bacterium]|nr:PKD domain-containing protein [Bacteroidales bacterium]
MNFKLLLIILISFTLNQLSTGQQETYTVTKAPFSSKKYDEFCPVYYKNGIVFSTNRQSGSLTNYSSSQDRGQVKINYIDTTGKVAWRKSGLFSKSLKTHFNDGPVTFSSRGDTIYYSRNLQVDGNYRQLSTLRNKLGIFRAVLEGEKWTKIHEMGFNNEWYNITMPCLSPDGKRLYFASDRPDGYGGADIYYSQWRNGYWEDPVNLGPLVNTKGNESYPFINNAGEFFFSSDGHEGLGGKDIFVTKQQGTGWYPPVRLDAPVNSEFDDFGIITHANKNEGYFSSNRGKTIDIFRFNSDLLQVWLSEPQKENQYCFTISDTGSIQIDTLRLRYKWDFGDDSKVYGTNVRHCFPGPGRYSINLDITDRRTGNLFFRKLTYDIEIVDNDQPFISSPDYAIIGEAVEFDGLKSYCPGYNVTGYFWNFGDGTTEYGERVNHTFGESGEYNVRLGLTLKSQTTVDVVKRAVTKKVIVFRSEQDRASYIAGRPVVRQNLTDIRHFENVKVNGLYSAETDFSREAVFQVVLLSSRAKTNLYSTFFRNVPAKYTVKELFDAEAGTWSYIVDEQMNLMATYPAYNEMVASGHSDARVRIFILKDPAEKELYILEKNNSLLTDTYFDANNSLTTRAYIMLDQVVMLMNKYPGIGLEIGVHTDNQGVSSNNLSLSQSRAQVIVNYMINRGISSKRLTAKGYGGNRPIASNTYPTDRRLNRRIDFTIFNK